MVGLFCFLRVFASPVGVLLLFDFFDSISISLSKTPHSKRWRDKKKIIIKTVTYINKEGEGENLQ